MENYDVAREECRKKHWITIEHVIVARNLWNTDWMRDAWITRKEWRATKNRKKSFSLFSFFLLLWRVDYQWIVSWSFENFDSILWAQLRNMPCRRRCNYYYHDYLWQLRAWSRPTDFPGTESVSALLFFCLRCHNLRRREMKKFAIVLWSQHHHHRFATK